MSFLLRTLRTTPIASRSSASLLSKAPSRSFHGSIVRTALNENDRARDNAADHVEHHKNDQLEKQKDGTNYWKPELASHSEEVLKHDKGHSKDDVAQLQKEHTEEHNSKS